jgi:hypothetical protein
MSGLVPGIFGFCFSCHRDACRVGHSVVATGVLIRFSENNKAKRDGIDPAAK